jgi:deoxyribodipyrimidine photo-lyase
MASSPLFDTAIHWFRRDLRLSDNTALRHAAAAAQVVVPVYIISRWTGEHRWTGAPRQQFLCGSLASLAANIALTGAQLIFRQGEAVAELERLIRETKAQAICTNRDPDPFGQTVEKALAARCAELGVEFHVFKDHVLHERSEVLTGQGQPYRVFTPYSKNWQSLPKPAPVVGATKLTAFPKPLASLPCPTLATWKLDLGTTIILEPGERAARARMKSALAKIVPTYQETRDTPFGSTTSRLSQDLRYGTLSIREWYAHLAQLRTTHAADPHIAKSIHTYINELAWREFYMQILWHFPEIYDHEFSHDWRGLSWDWDMEKFSRWKEGLTGFPIVDAGMRELKATGFMHNRVRMIVAMFLTKDLHLDWRMGEQYFMQALTDGEIASNNGGWQWSAGTGADAAPYFRIQNPWSQTKRYDPQGRYIRQWVPELSDAPLARLLEPPAPGSDGRWKNYPAPMLDHKTERDVCLARFKRHRAQLTSG